MYEERCRFGKKSHSGVNVLEPFALSIQSNRMDICFAGEREEKGADRGGIGNHGLPSLPVRAVIFPPFRSHAVGRGLYCAHCFCDFSRQWNKNHGIGIEKENEMRENCQYLFVALMGASGVLCSAFASDLSGVPGVVVRHLTLGSYG